MSDHCEILKVIGQIRHLDLGNGSDKFGNHWFRAEYPSVDVCSASGCWQMFGWFQMIVCKRLLG